MFRIRKVLDNTSSANCEAINQVLSILTQQFPAARKEEFNKLPEQLNDPLKYKYRSILFVAENAVGKVKGFAMLLHFPDINIAYLELISAALGQTSGGIGGALYEYLREECLLLKVKGLFFECSIDDPEQIKDPVILKQNIARLKFYERYGVYPIVNDSYATPVNPGDEDLYYLMMDDLGTKKTIKSGMAQKIVRAILERKYGELIPQNQIDDVVQSFTDKNLRFREPRYIHKPVAITRSHKDMESIVLVVNEGHSIHHVKDRGYVEAPVRLSTILTALGKTQLFKRIEPRRVSEAFIKKVHSPAYVDYLRRACAALPPGKSIYPIIFPLRNLERPPKDIELQVGYYCLDTFTPLNSNAYQAARGAVDCAVTAANAVLDGAHISYALVRPPGHHAERRTFGGFCYFNSAAIAAHHLSNYGKVAVLDIDFHHGNGTQDIFYERSDVLTVSIHGDPHFAYPHFSGFKDEIGSKEGEGFNINYPLAEHIDAEKYRRTLATAIKRIKVFNPAYLVVSLGLDTAKSDPTGTWSHNYEDFFKIGQLIGETKYHIVVVQEGGYRTQTLGTNAKYFFQGLWSGFFGQEKAQEKTN
ncbi:histone deacetylase [Methyloprofundus sedimenti]|uniref:Histone deacetylase n=1 Tax=Methyloprofundus sedimenti TaxID=1420851 RepID=A0A1V8M4I8_9GAMM|nr:histone deacetylase family protein [Methyloprofundus sedimenti]OQK16469.1 histone deacetylase [Methyloprofundus sedimenti]